MIMLFRSPVCQQSPDTTVVTPRTSPATGEPAAGGQEVPAGGGKEAIEGGQVSPDTITCGDCSDLLSGKKNTVVFRCTCRLCGNSIPDLFMPVDRFWQIVTLLEAERADELQSQIKEKKMSSVPKISLDDILLKAKSKNPTTNHQSNFQKQ